MQLLEILPWPMLNQWHSREGEQDERELVFLTLVFIGSAPHGGCIIKIIEPTAARNQGYSATGYSTLYHFWDLWVLRST